MPNKNHEAGHQIQLDDDFYEVMPYVGGLPYRDDADDADPSISDEEAAARRMAIITLIMAAVVAVALGLLLVRGLQVVRDASGSPTTANSY